MLKNTHLIYPHSHDVDDTWHFYCEKVFRFDSFAACCETGTIKDSYCMDIRYTVKTFTVTTLLLAPTSLGYFSIDLFEN